ncbi:Hypothetical_protein [Hexamita inflata]|uniref:Hypothetical_protein n=1 Tax=Hexamita inflata TaxID=28002 RepID=A0AA86QQC4_9EUKA|nr:Hypothetical protein HINF_LOCUS44874 [Hexamita inflata]
MSVLMRRENTLIIEPGSDISKIQIINFILLPNSKKHFEGPPLQNKIINADSLNHKYFSKYDFQNQKVPTTDELKFYNKILSVHSSHKQITKLLTENRAQKFRESMTHQKESTKLKVNEQIRAVNMKIEIWAQFIQNSYADQ